MKSATTTTKMKGAQLWPKSTRKPFTQCKTRLHDSAANIANSAFSSNRVTTSRPSYSYFHTKTPSFCDPIHQNNIAYCALSIGKTNKYCVFCCQGYSPAVVIFQFEL